MTWAHYRIAEPTAPLTATCTDIPPGECCKPHPSLFTQFSIFMKYSNLTVKGLLVDQLAAGWPAGWHHETYWTGDEIIPYPETFACEGIPLARFWGPGMWHTSRGDDPNEVNPFYAPKEDEMIFAASWVDLRTKFPPSGRETRYLQWQGVQGLIFGKNVWRAALGDVPVPRLLKRGKLNQWAKSGTAYIRPPARWRYPDLYEVNGTAFSAAGSGGYRSDDGQMLEFTNQRLLKS